MGKRIDRAALAVVCAALYYFFLLGAWGSIPLACLGAFACCVLTRGLFAGLRPTRRPGPARVRAELLRLAAMPESEAAAILEPLVLSRWPREDFTLAPALKHPEAMLSSGDVLSAWKANRDASRLVIAATCPCEPRARAYAQTLSQPTVAVVDSRALRRLLRSRPLPPVERPPILERMRRFCAIVLSLRASPRNALLAAALLIMYLLGGHPTCLFAALALLFHLGASMLHGRMGRRLFDQ